MEKLIIVAAFPFMVTFCGVWMGTGEMSSWEWWRTAVSYGTAGYSFFGFLYVAFSDDEVE